MSDDSKRIAILEKPITKTNIVFENPADQDGAEMWKLVKDSGVLDVNSSYSYLMMCKFYKDTCLVARSDGDLAGFVTAFIPPEKPDTVFVWQIGVSKDHQGKGIATKILKELLDRNKKLKFLEATVTPSNVPSASLFKGIAKKYDVACDISECFSEDQFPEKGHEAELTYRIGPIR